MFRLYCDKLRVYGHEPGQHDHRAGVEGLVDQRCITRGDSTRFLVFALVCSHAFIGCIHYPLAILTTTETDYSDEQVQAGGIQVGTVYELPHDVFLRKKEVPAQAAMLAPQGRFVPQGIGGKWAAPSSVEEYLNSPTEWGESSGREILGIVEAGTDIVCTKIRLRSNAVSGPSLYYLLGEIQGGKYRGIEVDFTDLTVPGDAEIGEHRINPRFPHENLLIEVAK